MEYGEVFSPLIPLLGWQSQFILFKTSIATNTWFRDCFLCILSSLMSHFQLEYYFLIKFEQLLHALYSNILDNEKCALILI